VHRSFHAITVQRRLSVSATGEDTSGVYGFINVFLRALQDWSPTHCAIAFDTSAPTFRHQSFEAYKAQREAAPLELRHQFQRVKQLMQVFGVPIFELDGYEADDIIGTICSQAEALDMDTLILTGDRDTFQLVSPRVRVDLASGIQDHKVYDEAELATRYAQRMLIENALSDAVRFFHMDALSSAVGMKVDFDMALLVIASSLYRLLAQRMRGYADAQARQIFRDLLDMPATVTISENEVNVEFHRRAHLPILLASDLFHQRVSIPWWNHRVLRLSTYMRPPKP